MFHLLPNRSQATRDGRSSSAIAVDICLPAWLSSGRQQDDEKPIQFENHKNLALIINNLRAQIIAKSSFSAAC